GGVDSDCRIIHYAHSLGGTDTNMAKNLLTPEELAKIEVVTFGSASLITEGDFGQVMNYVSRRDGIPMTDPFTYFAFIFGGEVPNVVFVGDYQGIPLVDHFFDSPNYRGVLDQLGASFIEQYGQFI
ncbi:MAG: hypothetical protein KDK78_01570, partial [Chlamydiia bacterium]|nr:hypothetical protein [Chlamydiia bacterium]